MGDEGGFAPNIGSNEEGLNLVNQAIEVSALTISFLVGIVGWSEGIAHCLGSSERSALLYAAG